MSISPRLSSKLHETLGQEATEALVTWMEDVGSNREELRSDIAELRQEVRADIAELRQEMQAGFSQSREQFRELHTTEKALIDRIHAVDNNVDRRYADLMKWSFVFWVGAVGAIALLAGVLR